MPKLKNPKAKGDKYERDLARYFNEYLFGGEPIISRAPLSGGGSLNYHAGGADLLGMQLWFPEAKAVEKLNFRSALAQAERNVEIRGTGETPVVFSKINREPIEDSVVALRLKNFSPLLKIQYQLNRIIEWDDPDFSDD